MFHKEKTISLKCGLVPVDVKIIPLVQWLNNFASVETYSSCEGDNGADAHVFFTANNRDLIYITKSLEIWYYDDDISLEVGYNPVKPSEMPYLKYTLTFKTSNRFKRALEIVHNFGMGINGDQS
jgi:hypothetical protein